MWRVGRGSSGLGDGGRFWLSWRTLCQSTVGWIHRVHVLFSYLMHTLYIKLVRLFNGWHVFTFLLDIPEYFLALWSNKIFYYRSRNMVFGTLCGWRVAKKYFLYIYLLLILIVMRSEYHLLIAIIRSNTSTRYKTE